MDPLSCACCSSLREHLQALHTHPDFWEEPLRFDPSRWLRPTKAEPGGNTSSMRTESADVPSQKTAFVPFLDGQRQCAGRFLAGEGTLVCGALY